MAKQSINIGTAANSKTGDPLRTAFAKVNANFDELYSFANADVQLPNQTGNGGKVLKTTGFSLLFEHISYNELTDLPQLFTGSYNDLSNKPMLFSGNYEDLTNAPAIPTDLSDLTDSGNVYISKAALKTLVAASTDFADFKARIAAL